MVRLVRWRLVFAASVTLAMMVSPNAAQDAGTVVAASPEATVAAAADASVLEDTAAPPAATEAAPMDTTATPAETEAATTPPAVTQAPVTTEAATMMTPLSTSTPAATEAATAPIATVSPVSTDATTTLTSTAAPPTSQVPSESSATILQEATSSQSNSLRGGEAESSASASSLSSSSASRSAAESTTGALSGSSSTKTAVICLLGAVGLTIISSLLFVVWRSRRREDPDMDTPIPLDTATITFPAVSMASIVAPTAQDMSTWKASGSSFASRDLPLTESTRAKLNATTRSSTEYDLANRPSQIASLSARGTSTHTPQANRETNASSEQSFSIRGYSEFSVHRAGDSETSAMTNERYSTNDGYSTSERYSTNDRYSNSSRLSSEPGRSNSGWFQHQVPKNLDMHRFSTASSASSAVARKHDTVSFINHDLTHTPCTEAPVTTDSTTSRTDVPDWYSVIESPTDNDRYTTTSLDSDNISDKRESFEL